MFMPLAIVVTWMAFFPSCWIAYTLPAVMVPTKSVPLSPRAMERAFGTLSAKTVISNPGGSLMRSKGFGWPWAIEAAARARQATARRFMVSPCKGSFRFPVRVAREGPAHVLTHEQRTMVAARVERGDDG